MYGTLEEELKAQFAGINGVLEAGHQGIASKVVGLEEKVVRLEGRFDRLEERFDRLEERFDRMEEKVDRMVTNTAAILKILQKHEG